MIFRSGLFSSRPDLTPSRFGEHWLKVHGQLASKMPGVHTYLQNHIRERLFEVSPFPDHAVDGISQQWFDDVAAMERCERSDEYAAVKRDIPNFQGAITILVFQAVPVFGAPPREQPPQRFASEPRKLVVLSTLKRPGLTQEETGVAITSVLRPAEGGPLACVQNLVVDWAHPVSANVPSGHMPVDAMAELFFTDAQHLRAWAASPAGQAFIHEHPLFVPLAAYAVEQIRIV